MRPSQICPLFLILAAAAFCAPAAAHERPTTTPAAQFLQGTLEQAFDLVRPPMASEANEDLIVLIERAMDWPSLTRFAVGHYGTGLSVGGMGVVTARLEQQLGLLARRAGTELPTMTIAIHDMRINPDGTRQVLSTATVPKYGEVEVEWTLARTQLGYRIADIRAFGLTLRQFLRGWVASLIAAQGGDAAAVFGKRVGSSPQ
ncbi:MAG TPA: hypothetical protein VFE34_09355 [Dongiaceae bacterium]|jgi:hypothetical protein|nr:hypothetical protein [Dongiaceae bacterium]